MVQNFRDGSHGTSWIPIDRFLVNAQRGAEAIDPIDARFLHLPQELPGVARQRLHEPPLALLVDGVEGQ